MVDWLDIIAQAWVTQCYLDPQHGYSMASFVDFLIEEASTDPQANAIAEELHCSERFSNYGALNVCIQ